MVHMKESVAGWSTRVLGSGWRCVLPDIMPKGEWPWGSNAMWVSEGIPACLSALLKSCATQ